MDNKEQNSELAAILEEAASQSIHTAHPVLTGDEPSEREKEPAVSAEPK